MMLQQLETKIPQGHKRSSATITEDFSATPIVVNTFSKESCISLASERFRISECSTQLRL